MMTPETPSAATLRELQERNQALEKQVQELQQERDRYIRAIHSLAKEQITEELVRGWMAEEKVEGSLMEFIEEAKVGV